MNSKVLYIWTSTLADFVVTPADTQLKELAQEMSSGIVLLTMGTVNELEDTKHKLLKEATLRRKLHNQVIARLIALCSIAQCTIKRFLHSAQSSDSCNFSCK